MIDFKTSPSGTNTPAPAASHPMRTGPKTAMLCGGLIAASVLLAGCTSVKLTESGALSSYDNLGTKTGQMAKSRTYVDKASVGAARTVRIVPALLTPAAAGQISKPQDRALVSNALDRAICVALSDKYVIVAADQPADLTIRNVVTGVVPTNKAAAGVSSAVSLGSSFVLPVSVPRLPFGMGGLAVEGEVVDSQGSQVAAMVWARGANAITNKPRLSEVGDAYALAAAYGDSFSKLVIKGKAPASMDISLPSGQRINSFFGGKPKYAACDTFGRAPGVAGMVSGMVGAPPEWTDGAKGR